jgi:dTDP-glucose 4,6-dehydratase
MTRVIITGGCGFIGHHLVEHVHKNTDWDIIVLDSLDYSSFGFDRLKCSGIYESERVETITIDLAAGPFKEGMIRELGDVQYIFHLAAETHVDNSIKEPVKCIHNNVMSTAYLLEYARHHCPNLITFLYFSTDEVYGTAHGNTMFSETDRHIPSNPYSASKSASEKLCISYKFTYKLPLKVVNVMNVFGERQHVEKFIPKCIKTVLNGDTIPIHCHGDSISGTRYYIHARNVAAAVMFIINNGENGEIFHINGEREISNLDMAKFIAKTIGKELKYELIDGETVRPGIDIRYCLDGSKLSEMGFKLPVDFFHSLENMIRWTIGHKQWLE